MDYFKILFFPEGKKHFLILEPEIKIDLDDTKTKEQFDALKYFFDTQLPADDKTNFFQFIYKVLKVYLDYYSALHKPEDTTQADHTIKINIDTSSLDELNEKIDIFLAKIKDIKNGKYFSDDFSDDWSEISDDDYD